MKVVVHVWWGASLLCARRVAPGKSFSLGESEADVIVSREALGSTHERLISERGGVPVVHVTPRARGSLLVPGQRVWPLERLRSGPTFRRDAPAIELSLATEAQLDMELGDLHIIVWSSAAEHAMRGSPVVDGRLTACMAAGALFALAVGAWAHQAMPPLGETTSETIFAQASPAMWIVGTEREQAEPEPDASAPFGDEEVSGHDHRLCRCHEAGTMGDRQATGREHRYGVAGPPDNPDPHIARHRGERRAGFSPPIGLTPLSWAAADEPTAPWGRDDSLGTDPLSARGDMWGEDIADTRGDGALGSSEGSRRADKIIVASVSDARGGPAPPRVSHTGLQLAGPLRPSEVLPAVAARFARFQSCYRRALASAPESEGRVELVFTIATDGSITDLGTDGSFVGDEALPGCLHDAVETLSFPSHREGATRVRYPLLFERGSAAAARSRNRWQSRARKGRIPA